MTLAQNGNFDQNFGLQNDHLVEIYFSGISRRTYDMNYAELFALGLSGMHQN